MLPNVLLADIGADANLEDISLIDRIQSVSGTVQVQDLFRPVLFSLAVRQGRNGGNIDIICHKKAVLNV